ncbi:hypothetical protein VPH35_077950 [Triticum aestivum]|uniref:Uncharacterized protein n=1 Tax=Aegilops tauschii TaxID=37682 RepID=N1R018_AEGTA
MTPLSRTPPAAATGPAPLPELSPDPNRPELVEVRHHRGANLWLLESFGAIQELSSQSTTDSSGRSINVGATKESIGDRGGMGNCDEMVGGQAAALETRTRGTKIYHLRHPHHVFRTARHSCGPVVLGLQAHPSSSPVPHQSSWHHIFHWETLNWQKPAD